MLRLKYGHAQTQQVAAFVLKCIAGVVPSTMHPPLPVQNTVVTKFPSAIGFILS